MEQSEGGSNRCRPEGETFYMAHIHASCRRMLIRESEERNQDDWSRARVRGTLLPQAVRERKSRRVGAKTATRRAYLRRGAYPKAFIRVVGGKLLDPRRLGPGTGRPFGYPNPSITGTGAGRGYHTVPYLPVGSSRRFPKKKRASSSTTAGYVLTHWISGE